MVGDTQVKSSKGVSVRYATRATSIEPERSEYVGTSVSMNVSMYVCRVCSQISVGCSASTQEKGQEKNVVVEIPRENLSRSLGGPVFWLLFSLQLQVLILFV